jgi:hypothetical protein
MWGHEHVQHMLRVVDYPTGRNLHFIGLIELIEQNAGDNCLYLGER